MIYFVMKFIRGKSLDVGPGVVTALGSVARSANIMPPLSFTNQASAGYIVLQTPNPVMGTTDPPANVIP